ncbi:MAG: hypothetical protein SGI88_21985 [Candidatus Hydrogenedentes bacterium]|nr:hypothetical protein [Candidatus Hydrogenedentota bacterium]
MPPLMSSALYIQPDLRRKRVTVTVPETLTDPVELSISGLSGSLRAAAGTHVLDLPDFKVWSPDAPALYTLQSNNEPVAQFGMREFTVKDHRFHLNNRPIVLRGLNCRESDPMSEAWLHGVKKSGFTFLRMCEMPAPAWLLDAADALGMMVCDTVDVSDERAARASVMARRNHASIVMWGVIHRYEDTQSREKAIRLVHGLDPSRVIASGLDAIGAEALYMRPYHDDISRLDAITAHLPAPSTPRGERYYENVGSPNDPSILISFGAIGWHRRQGENNAVIETALAERELTTAFPNAEALIEAVEATRIETVKAQLQAARLNSKLSGYCLDAQGAVPSPSLASVQTPMLLALRAARTTLVPREEVPVTVTVVNDDRVEPLADLSLQVVGPTNQVLWKKKRSVKVPKQTREIWSGTISASGSVGTHRFVVRLMQGMKLLCQNSMDLHVVEPTTAGEVELSVLDPQRQWSDRCLPLGRTTGAKPRVYVLPPLANTIRGYPETDLLNVLAEVRAGAVGLVIGPPRDWNDLADRIDDSIRATTTSAIDAYHYIRLHPVFEGLPARCLMRQPFRNLAPRAAFEDTSDESIAGALAFRDGEVTWSEDLLVRRFGAGRIVFTHLRFLDHLGMDPVADRLFVNVLRHFGRRSVPSDDTPSLPQSVLDWSRRERAERAKLWSVIGPFANWDHAGHDTVYPPEQNVDLSAVHAGWRDAVRWTRWFALGEVISDFSIDDALGLPFVGEATVVPETFYAYCEWNTPARQAAQLNVRTKVSVKVFVNGALSGAHETASEDTNHELFMPVTLKQGKNSMLIKLSRQSASARIIVELTSATRDPLLLKWWR